MSPYNIEEELNVLDPKKLQVYRDEFNSLRLKMQGNESNGEDPEIQVSMGFPLTNSDHFISLIEMKDGKRDKEIGMIEDVRKLDSKSKKILRWKKT